jgi:peroxiredoxin Q/BCP
MTTPDVGDMAPDFTLPNQDGETVSLSDSKGDRIVLYFYPKDFTSGCTKEACSFRDMYPDYEGEDAVIIGVSTDSVESHRKFADKHQLPFTLLSDEDRKVSEKYGVYKEKNIFGKKRMGIVRSTFLIDENFRIAKVYRSVRVKGHSEKVLEDMRDLV